MKNKKLHILDIMDEDVYLENKDIVDINFIDGRGRNALFYAVYDKAKWLIKHGINVNQIDKYGCNVLFFSTGIEYKELFIKSGVNVNYESDNGLNCLVYCLTPESATLILDSGFDLNLFRNNPEKLEHIGNDKIKEIVMSRIIEEDKKLLDDIIDINKKSKIEIKNRL